MNLEFWIIVNHLSRPSYHCCSITKVNWFLFNNNHHACPIYNSLHSLSWNLSPTDNLTVEIFVHFCYFKRFNLKLLSETWAGSISMLAEFMTQAMRHKLLNWIKENWELAWTWNANWCQWRPSRVLWTIEVNLSNFHQSTASLSSATPFPVFP